MVTALVGTNWYKVKQSLDDIYTSFARAHGELAVERLQGSDVSLEEIKSITSAVTLFTSDKLVVVYDLSQNKQAAEQVDELIESINDETHLVLVETGMDKRSAYYKRLKKLENFIDCSEPTAIELEKWAIDYIQKSGGELSKADARYLIERIGINQALIERELAKLVQYDPKVSRQSIDELTEQTPTSTIFNLIDLVFAGNVAGALKLYDEQRSQKVEPQAIFGMMVWQMHLVAVCVTAGSRSASDIASETGLNAYSLGKAQAISKRMGKQKVAEFLDLLAEIEMTSKKQTYNLDDALKYAIIKLAY